MTKWDARPTTDLEKCPKSPPGGIFKKYQGFSAREKEEITLHNGRGGKRNKTIC
jgi:hypothetical protein